ncbi:MAG: hypothetical protein M1836_005093 [Candelina mexicana]|nr:MAG: hypothetical protein M1836_005093 [Candelina mexicana]
MAEDSEFAQIWAEAYSTYQEKTGRNLLNNPTLSTLRTTEDLLAQIEEREQRFENFRNKKAKLWLVLRRTMDQVVTLGGVAQGALQASPFAPASAGLGAVLFLVGAAKGVSSAYDCITDLLSKLEDFTDRLQEYTKGTIDSKLRRKVTAILTTLLEIFARSEKLIDRKRWKEYFVVSFLGKDEKVAAAMGRLESLVENEEKLVASLTYSTGQKTGKIVERIDSAVERTEKNISKSSKTLEEVTKLLKDRHALNEADSDKSVKEGDECRLLEKLLHTASLEIVQELYEQISDQRLDGTGEWVTSEPLFKAWMDRRDPILWILGGPGAGKSFLSSKIISHLQNSYPQHPQYPTRVSVGYFYIKENDQQLRSLNTMLKSIAYQIASNDVVYRKYVLALCDSPKKISTATLSWRRLFIEFFGSPQYRSWSTYIVIDGLDEAPKQDREVLLKLLKTLQDAPQDQRAHIQIAIVGRPELREDINRIWEEDVIFIEVSARKNTADIASYISNRIHRVKILKKNFRPSKAGFNKAELQSEIVAKLTEGANGMFLWVNLMLDQIYNKSRPSEIRAALNDAPHDLAEMIRRVFKRLDDNPDVGREDLNEMLAWVTCALRPLALGEMDVILKLRPPVGEGMLVLEDRLRGQFASLFTLTRDDAKTTEDLIRDTQKGFLSGQEPHSEKIVDHETNDEADESDGELDKNEGFEEGFESDFMTTILQFSHTSIRDYLVQEGRPDSRKWPLDIGIGIEINKAQYHIAQTCLSILISATHGTVYKPPNLIPYAVEFGMSHLLDVDKSLLNPAEKQAILRPLLQLFHAQSSTETRVWYYRNLQTMVQDWDLLQCVRDWFADEEASIGQFSDVERSLIRQMGSSYKGLLEHLALFSVKEWLADEERFMGHYVDDVLFLHFYHALVSMPALFNIIKLSWNFFDNNDYEAECMKIFDVGLIPLPRIYQLAEFGNLEKSIRWHNSLATTLRQAGYIDAAIEENFNSLRLNEHNPWATTELAWCYLERKEYALAIKWKRKSIDVAPENNIGFASESYLAIALWSRELKDYGGAIAASREAWHLNRDDLDCMCVHILNLKRASHPEMLDFVESLAKINNTITSETLLTEMLIGCEQVIIEYIANAARALGKMVFMQSAIETAIAVADRRGDDEGCLELVLKLATFCNKYARDKPRATDLWEYIVEVGAKKGSSVSPRFVKQSSDELSQVYFAYAVAVEGWGMYPGIRIRELEALSHLRWDFDTIGTGDPSMMIGLWYRLHDWHQEAKACFRPRILEMIEILTDDDPSNDRDGYVTLMETLLHAGDKQNAAAAAAMILLDVDKAKNARQAKLALAERAERLDAEQGKRGTAEDEDVNKLSRERSAAGEPLKDHVTDTPRTATDTLGVEVDDKRPTVAELQKIVDDADNLQFCGCDGDCNWDAEDWTAFYFCEICLDTCFCDHCIELVKTDELPFDKCSSKHTFLQGYPIDKDALEIAATMVDGKYVVRKEWLDMLRKKWAD